MRSLKVCGDCAKSRMMTNGSNGSRRSGGEERKLVTGGLVEEVAAIRYWLRNSYRRAMETEDIQEYVRLVDLYSSGCVRLAGLIHVGGDESDWLVEKIGEEIREALEEVAKELIDGGEDV